MSPEQARNSAAADIRSDIYSLGCTLYHMLAGKSPFPEGSLTERIYHHVETDPGDIREKNPKVSPALAAVLQRMLAKKPEDRYQTPLELLKDLKNLDGVRVTQTREEGISRLADLAEEESHRERMEVVDETGFEEDDDVLPTRKSRRRQKFRDSDEDEERPRKARHASKPKSRSATPSWWPLPVSLVAVISAVIVIWLVTGGMGSNDDSTDSASPPNRGTQGATPIPIVRRPWIKLPDLSETKKPPPKTPDKEPARKSAYPPLYEPSSRLNLIGVGDNMVGSIKDFPQPDAKATVLIVSRSAPNGPNVCRSLDEAVSKTAKGQESIVEIRDNGPLFQSALPEVKDRNIFLKAGAGYRPLIAWHVPAKTEPTFPVRKPELRWLGLTKGRLVLENLDFVVKWTKRDDREANFFRIRQGELHARGCTFSVAGVRPKGTTVVMLQKDHLTGTAWGQKSKCAWHRCYARGEQLTAVASDACESEVLLEDCLAVSSTGPLFAFATHRIQTSTLRLVRSTIVTGSELIALRSLAEKEKAPRLTCHLWDSILALNDRRSRGEMVHIANRGSANDLRWLVVNCLYAGWKKLLAADREIVGGSVEQMRNRFSYAEGDRELRTTWPAQQLQQTEQIAARFYNPLKTEACFAATSHDGMVGCDVDKIPQGPKDWLPRTYDDFIQTPLPVLTKTDPPLIPASTNGRYSGERIDLKGVDLGKLLEKRLAGNPAERVVLHLAGKGDHTMTPVKISSVEELVIYFEPAPKPTKKKEKAQLVLVPDPSTSAKRQALFEVEGAKLHFIGVKVRFDDSRFTPMPNHLIKMTNGDLRLQRCDLRGPVYHSPDNYRSLLRLAGNAECDLDVNESILVSMNAVASIADPQARIRVRQSVLAGEGAIVRFDIDGQSLADTKVLCRYDENTIATGSTFIDFMVEGKPPASTVPFVVQCNRNVFLNPFPGKAGKATLLTANPSTSFAHGLVSWHGKGNVFDSKRLLAAGRFGKDQVVGWERLWGPRAESSLDVDVPPGDRYTFETDKADLKKLAVPLGIAEMLPNEKPGADLVDLGVVRKRR